MDTRAVLMLFPVMIMVGCVFVFMQRLTHRSERVLGHSRKFALNAAIASLVSVCAQALVWRMSQGQAAPSGVVVAVSLVVTSLNFAVMTILLMAEVVVLFQLATVARSLRRGLAPIHALAAASSLLKKSPCL